MNDMNNLYNRAHSIENILKEMLQTKYLATLSKDKQAIKDSEKFISGCMFAIRYIDLGIGINFENLDLIDAYEAITIYLKNLEKHIKKIKEEKGENLCS